MSSNDGLTNFLLNNIIGVIIVLHIFMFIFWFVWEPGFWIIFWILTVYCVFMFFYEAPYKTMNLYKNPANTLVEPVTLFNMIAALLLFYVSVFLFEIPMNSGEKPWYITLIEALLWTFFTFILFLDFFNYIVDINLLADMKSNNPVAFINKVFNGHYTNKHPTEKPHAITHVNPQHHGKPTEYVFHKDQQYGKPTDFVLHKEHVHHTTHPNETHKKHHTTHPNHLSNTACPCCDPSTTLLDLGTYNTNNTLQLSTTQPDSLGRFDLYATMISSCSSFPLILKSGLTSSINENAGLGSYFNEIICINYIATADPTYGPYIEAILLDNTNHYVVYRFLTKAYNNFPAGSAFYRNTQTTWSGTWNHYIILNPGMLLDIVQAQQTTLVSNQGSSSTQQPTITSKPDLSSLLPTPTITQSTTTTPIGTGRNFQNMSDGEGFTNQTQPMLATNIPISPMNPTPLLLKTNNPTSYIDDDSDIITNPPIINDLNQMNSNSNQKDLNRDDTNSNPVQDFNNQTVPIRKFVDIQTPLPPSSYKSISSVVGNLIDTTFDFKPVSSLSNLTPINSVYSGTTTPVPTSIDTIVNNPIPSSYSY